MSDPHRSSVLRMPLRAADSVRTWITILGCVNLLCSALYVGLSYGLAPTAAFGGVEVRERALLANVGRSLSRFGFDVEGYFRGETPLAQVQVALVAYYAPVLTASAVFVGLVAVLALFRRDLDSSTPRFLFRWASTFSIVQVAAIPVLYQDFWWYLAYGRVLISGVSPYSVLLTPEFVGDLPVDDLGLLRLEYTYGPAWALVSGFSMWLAGNNGPLGAVVLKLILLGAWLGSLGLIRNLLRDRSLWHQCAGIAIFGWLPLSPLHGLADAHNDTFLLLLILLWMYGLERDGATRASLALAASVLTKYVTAPLFVLDALHHARSRNRSSWTYVPRAGAAAVLLLVGFAVFIRSPDAFAWTTRVRDWDFLSPARAMLELEALFGLQLGLSAAIQAAFIILAVLYVVRYARSPNSDTFREAVLASLAGVVFSASFSWPWYLVWVVGVAALVPSSPLSRWVIGVALAMPLAMVVMRALDPWHGYDTYSLPLYLGAVLWFLLAPRDWFAGGLEHAPRARRQSSSAGHRAPERVARPSR